MRNMSNCQYCNKEISNLGSLRSHQKRCPNNPNKINWVSGSKGPIGIEPWNKGKTYQQLLGVQKANQLKRKFANGKGGRASTLEKQKLRRQRISETCKRNKKSGGYRIGSGRCKGSWYQSPIAGRVYLDSSYEVFYAQWLDKANIIWKRNKIKFPYTYENQQHYYIPDFYLVEQKCYIETKGYKTKKDEAKWKEFPYQLKVLYQKDLNELGMKQWRVLQTAL